jgi:predicted  nucleic acid-binding Zn-ribbon protein
VNDSLQNTPGDLDEIKARMDTIEETVETVCRPVADMFSLERVHTIERTGYETLLRIDTLDKTIGSLEGRITDLQTALVNLQASVSEAQRAASEAVRMSSAVTNSRIWQSLIKASSFLLRFSGRSGQSGQ